MKPFEISKALLLAKISAIDYENDYIKADAEVKALGFEVVKHFGNVNGLSGFICKNSEFSVVSFQGTDPRERETVLADIKCWHTHVDHVAFASGFYQAYCELSPGFCEYIQNCKQPLFITGHSLGGAIAHITALQLADYMFEACYTFGAPRVCSKAGLTLCNGKAIYRLVHNSDIVPSLPLWVLGYYVHVGDLFFITDDDKLLSGAAAYAQRVISQGMPIVKLFLKKWLPTFHNIFTLFGMTEVITEHFIDQYIKALEIINLQG